MKVSKGDIFGWLGIGLVVGLIGIGFQDIWRRDAERQKAWKASETTEEWVVGKAFIKDYVGSLSSLDGNDHPIKAYRIHRYVGEPKREEKYMISVVRTLPASSDLRSSQTLTVTRHDQAMTSIKVNDTGHVYLVDWSSPD